MDTAHRVKSKNSIGLRLEHYRNSLKIIHDHLIAGVGTGGIPVTYADRVMGTGNLPAPNPHNEHLLNDVQSGLALLLYLFAQQLMLAQHLASPLETHLARSLVITMAVGCLLNSFLLDHTEEVFYA